MDQLKERYSTALSQNNLPELQVIISELNALPPSKKEALKDWYAQIGEQLFEKSINVSNYNKESFFKEAEKSSSDKSSYKKKEEVFITDDFEETFLLFHNVYSGDVDPCIPDQADPLCEGMLVEV